MYFIFERNSLSDLFLFFFASAAQEIAAPAAGSLVPSDRASVKAVADLDYLDAVLSGTVTNTRGPLAANKYRRFEPVVRPAPQTVSAPANEEVTQAVLLLQRLLRGRAVQESMRASRARSQPLINELRLLESAAGAAEASQLDAAAAAQVRVINKEEETALCRVDCAMRQRYREDVLYYAIILVSVKLLNSSTSRSNASLSHPNFHFIFFVRP